jgi:hypothetical protein
MLKPDRFFFILLVFPGILFPASAFSEDGVSRVEVTPVVREYAANTVRPALDASAKKDRLSQLLKVSEILIDPATGVCRNSIAPAKFIFYDKLEKIGLGFLVTFSLAPGQKKILESWHLKFMGNTPSDVFFRPAADDVVGARAAFGCSHFARSFIAVVKALDLVDRPEDLRYAVSCKAGDYNRALEKQDREATINGHQFALVKIDSGWIAINTSKAEWIAMPKGFSPEVVRPPENTAVRFKSYPGVTFLLRKIGKDGNDDCSDDSLERLVNIYRSGDVRDSGFRWERYEGTGDG